MIHARRWPLILWRPEPLAPFGFRASPLVGLLAALAVAFSVGAAAPPPPPAVDAAAAILVDARTGRVLFARNEHQRLPPASTTKIMTALLAAEALPLDALVAISARAAPPTRGGGGGRGRWAPGTRTSSRPTDGIIRGTSPQRTTLPGWLRPPSPIRSWPGWWCSG